VRQDAGSGRIDALQRLEWLVALLATLAAVVLSLEFSRHAGAFWRDEVNSLNVALAPSLAELWRLMEFESGPALWTLLLRVWAAAVGGSSDAALRMFGVLGGLALPAAVWFAGLRLGRGAPVVSLALLAVNPEVIRWSASLRPWGLGAALAVVALVLVREAGAEPGRRRVLLAALCAVLSVQCVYQNAVLLAASIAGAVAVALVERRWRSASVAVGIGLVAALSLSIYLPTLGRIGEWSMLNQAPVTLGLLAPRGGAVFAASGSLVLAGWLAFLGLALGLGGWRALRRDDRDGVVLFALVTALAAVVGFALFLLQVRYLTQPWYYVGLLAVVAVCAEAALAASLRAPVLRVGLALAVMLAGLPGAWSSLRARQTNLDAIAAYLETHATRGDLVVANPWYYAITLGRYYHGEAEVSAIPPLEDLRVHRFDLLKRQMASATAMAPLEARVREVLEAGGQVWIVGGIAAPPRGRPPRSLSPPPLPSSGWAADPYRLVWTFQLGALVAAHAEASTPVPIDVPGGPFEGAGLVLIRGWR